MLSSLSRRLTSLRLPQNPLLKSHSTSTAKTKTKTKTKAAKPPSKSTTKKPPSKSTTKKPPPVPSDLVVRFLTDTCNLPLPAALSAARTLRLSSLDNPHSVLSLLRSHGLSPAQISSLLARLPSLLLSSPAANLSPKFRFLSALLPPSSLPSLLLSYPRLLRRSLDSHLKPTFSLLHSLLPSPDHLLRMVRRDAWILSCNVRATLAPNLALLLDRSVPSENIGKLLVAQPRVFTSQPSAFSEAVETVVGLGLKPRNMLFLHGVRAMAAIGRPGRERRMQLLRELGWSDEDFKVAFRRAPLFLLVSEEKMRRVMAYLVSVVGLEVSTVSASPKLLMYGLEKRIMPRFAVVRVLEEKGVVRKGKGKGRNDNKARRWMFLCPDEEFLDQYVRKNIGAVPELMDVFHGKIGLEILSSEKGRGPAKGVKLFNLVKD